MVRAGATAVRRAAVNDILSAGYIDVIKGNESEIKTVFGYDSTLENVGSSTADNATSQRGVDSSSTLSNDEKAILVSRLAAREQAIVVMTGKTDFVSDGLRTYGIANGHELLGVITGTGCTLGTTISAMVAAVTSHEGHGDKLVAVIAGILLFEIAAAQAARKSDVKGPGSFQPAFLDSLYELRTKTFAGDMSWLQEERVMELDVSGTMMLGVH